MVEEKEARTQGKRVRPEGRREGGRRLIHPEPVETAEEEQGLEEFEDVLMAFDADEKEATPEETREFEGQLSLELPEDEEEGAAAAVEPASPAKPAGRRVRGQEADRGAPSQKTGLWGRAMDACTDLAGRVLDWTDELSERFDEMASDPENDSLVAQVIRGSEDIVEGLEEQQRETDAEIDEEERIRAARGQHKREVQPQPKLVFYTADNPDTPVDLRELAKERGKTGGKTRENAAQSAEKAPTRETGITRDALIDQFSPQPEEPEQTGERAPEKRRKRAEEPAPRRAAEKPRREVSRRTLPESEPVRQRPAKPALPKEERQQVIRMSRKLQYGLFVLALGFFGILGLLGPLRADSTEVEHRPLTEKPAVSVVGLWKGDYFGRLEQWYSDTYPLRDKLAGEYDLLSPLGFGPVTVNHAAAEVNEDKEKQEDSLPTGSSSPETGTAAVSQSSESGAPSVSPGASE